jgi:type II secretion system protein L
MMSQLNNNLNVMRWQQGEGLLIRSGHAPERFDPAVAAIPDNLCVAFPADAVRSLTISIAPEEIKHLQRALPFMLEESLLEDVEQLHFAALRLDDDVHGIAVVARATITGWSEELPDSLQNVPWVSEALCLPWSPEQCTVVFEEQHAVVRWGQAEGGRIEHALLPALMEGIALEEQTLIVYTADQPLAQATIPTQLYGAIQWRQGGFPEALLLADSHLPGPDLRQGEFAPRLPLARWWAIWQRVALALMAACVLKTGFSVADYQMLKAEDLQLRQAIQTSYRRVNPRGAVVDVEKQLDRQLGEFGAGTQGSAFTPIIVSLLTAIQKVDGIQLTALNYSGKGDLRLSLSAPDFESVEQVREQLKSESFSAQLENSNARSDGVVARLRVQSP